MPLKPHPTDPDKMVYASRQYPWSQKTMEQKAEAMIRHYKKEIELTKEAGDPLDIAGLYEAFVICLESILEKNT